MHDVSRCANSKCGAEFRRLGEGKLFVGPANPKANATRLRQKAVWLCDSCALKFRVQFDESRESYKLVRSEQAA